MPLSHRRVAVHPACAECGWAANDANDLAISRHHFDAALDILTVAHATDATLNPQRLLLAG